MVDEQQFSTAGQRDMNGDSELSGLMEGGDVSRAASKHAPVILITGTPGTGKTTHAQLVAEQSPIPMRHISVGELVKEKGLQEGYDEEWQSYTVDEDKVPMTFVFRFEYKPTILTSY